MKKIVIISVVLLILATAATVLLWPYFTTHKLTISGDHIQSVSVESGNKTTSYSNLSEVRIPNEGTVVVSYQTDNEDYSDGSIAVVGSETEITIKPEYSQAKREELAKSAFSAISAELKKLYTNMDLYTIAPGDVYQRGTWYATALVYKGVYGLHSDTLRVVAKNDGKSWVVMTLPEILLTTEKYSDIPTSVLQEANLYSN